MRRFTTLVGVGALVVASAVLGAGPARADPPAFNLNGTWSVTLSDVGCTGQNQGPYPMSISGFNETTGSFAFSFHAGAVTGMGVESVAAVTFDAFAGPGTPPLNATAMSSDGTLTMQSVVGKCPSNGGTNEWDFTFAGGIVVNSTLTDVNDAQAQMGDCNVTPAATTPTCTLAQAITVANDNGGGSITFDIPHSSGNVFDASVPQIRYPSGAPPAIAVPVTIDATTQPTVARVELSGASLITIHGPFRIGLDVVAGGADTTIKGMTINGFNDQITLQGGGDTIQDNHLETNNAGTAVEWDPLDTNASRGGLYDVGQTGVSLMSSGSQIGGTSSGEGNVIGLSWAPGAGSASPQAAFGAAIYDGDGAPGGNVIQGNDLGVRADADDELIDAEPKGTAGFDPEAALNLTGADTVGGTEPGAGNRVAGAIFAGASTVQANTFFGRVGVTGPATVGGATSTPGTGPGNTFLPEIFDDPTLEVELSDDNAHATVEGNVFNDPDNDDVLDAVTLTADGATLGGTSSAMGNLIENMSGLYRNPDRLSTVRGAVTIAASHTLVEHNVFVDNHAVGAIEVDRGDANTITQNVMSGNVEGTVYGNGRFVLNHNAAVNAAGPNDLFAYPVLFSTQSTSAGTVVSGKIDDAGTVTVELYSQATCSPAGPIGGEGYDYLGSQTVSSLLGDVAFTLTFPAVPAGQDAITATATSSNASTSEFSPCLLTDSEAHNLLGAGVVPETTTVPVSPGAAKPALRPLLARAATTKP
ncbi:MAG: hypothetical protein ACRDV0_04965, partial [Acidimicrobiales bacterium]